MANIERVADIVSRLAKQPGVRMLVGESTDGAGGVRIGSSVLTVSRWVGKPAAAGEGVVVLMQGGSAVGISADSEGGIFVRRSGDIMTGNLMLVSSPNFSRRLILDGTDDSGYGEFALFRNGNARWFMRTGDNASDVSDGSNKGAVFELHSRTDNGGIGFVPMRVKRDTGSVYTWRTPVWRGRLNNVTLPNATVVTPKSLNATYSARDITYSATTGRWTVGHEGVYGLSVQGQGAHAPSSSQRFLVSWKFDAFHLYRQTIGPGETFIGHTAIWPLNAGGTAELEVYQNIGVSSTFSNIFVSIIRLGDL